MIRTVNIPGVLEEDVLPLGNGRWHRRVIFSGAPVVHFDQWDPARFPLRHFWFDVLCRFVPKIEVDKWN